MEEAALVFLGLVILSVVNFLGFRQLVRALGQTRTKT
jgi:hypothetical protein